MANNTTAANESSFELHCACKPPPSIEACLLHHDGHQKGKDRRPYEKFLILDGGILKICRDIKCKPENFFGAAWSLLLRYFVGQRTVAFDFIVVDEEVQSHCYTVSGVVQGQESSRELVTKFQRSSAAIDCKCSNLLHHNLSFSESFDTTVLFHSFSDSTADKDLISPNSIMELQVYKNDSTFSCLISFDQGKISEKRVDDVASSLRSILTTMAAQGANRPIGKILLFSDRQLFEYGSRLQNTPSRSQRFLHELMDSHAVTSPDSSAVCAWDRNFTYKEVKEHSDRLAFHLKSLGVGQGTIVPILSVKCSWVPVCALAILKTGAAFLPLDPSHPAERLQMLISRVNALVIICSDCPVLVENLVFPTIERRVHISAISNLPQVPEDVKPFKMLDNTVPAYIMFTSGSTGLPKAVVVDHSAIVTSTYGFGAATKLSSSSRILQFSAHSFDVCILELCSTLVFGGTVCIPSERERLDDLAGCMQRMKVNRCFITPTIASLLNHDDIPSLTDLLLGGEQLHAENIAKWAGRLNLYNGYGPAEASILCAINEIPDAKCDPRHIGPPCGCSAWIVNYDDDSLLCPDGTPGELVIMGSIVALSYLDDPEKTAKAFIQQPNWFHDETFSVPENCHRLYKTGDSAYMKHDGTIMIIGRRDNQIKLHGQRIELGEIESNLRQVLPDQTTSIVDVIAPGGDDSNKQLAAFVVLPKGENDGNLDMSSLKNSLLPILEQIRADMHERLPKYMCPSVFIPIAKMPETTSNKADRKALRALGSSMTVHEISAYNGIERDHRNPSTDEEELMILLWSEVLKLEPSDIGTNDSFFTLGGDSIKAIQLVKAAEKVGSSISYNDIFKNPKLSELALAMQETVETENTSIEPYSIIKAPRASAYAVAAITLNGIRLVNVEDYYPSTAEQDRTFRQTLANQNSHFIIFPYQLGREVNVEKFRKACEILFEAFPIFRTRLVPMSKSTSLQVVMKEKKIEWQYLKNGPEEVKKLAIDFGMPLTSWAISTSEEDGKDKFFVCAIHHALLDGWSMNLFWEALTYAYENGKAPIVPSHFNSLIKYYHDRDNEETDNFWISELKEAHASILLTMSSESYIPFQTDRLENKVVFDKLSSSSFTMNTVLQVAFALALWHYEKSQDIVFRTTGTGRNQPVTGIQEIIGAVLTSFPVRIKSELTEPLTILLKRIQNHTLEVTRYEYRGIEHIKTLADNSNGIVCDSNSPYLIVQTETFNKPLEGMTRLPTPWAPSQTPLAICCILKPHGMKIATGFDNHMISKAVVEGLLTLFENLTKTIVGFLNLGPEGVDVERVLQIGGWYAI